MILLFKGYCSRTTQDKGLLGEILREWEEISKSIK